MSGNSIFSVESGKKVARYEGLDVAVDVAWHPLDYTSCIVEYGNCGVAMYSYDTKTPPLRVHSLYTSSKKSITHGREI
jgi:hypothetical protein